MMIHPHTLVTHSIGLTAVFLGMARQGKSVMKKIKTSTKTLSYPLEGLPWSCGLANSLNEPRVRPRIFCHFFMCVTI
jgi:hypothetical protein